MPEFWVWVAADIVYAIHDRQIAEHGGAAGTRDIGAVESALARPKNLVGYGTADAADLAAAYAYGVEKSHGFVDGNKRTAWVVARLFLRLNEMSFRFEPVDAVVMMEGIAAGTVSDQALAEWLRKRIVAG